MKVLCVVAHADDEVLGCGGTLAKHSAAGDQVTVLCFCPRQLGAELRASCDALRAHSEVTWGFADQRFDTVPLSSLIAAVELRDRPDLVYTHSPDDLNLDHELTARAVLTAYRPTGRRAPSILCFETISSTEWSPEPFRPNWYVALTQDEVIRKVTALGCYPSELREPPHPRNREGVENAARTRGAQAGVEYAEGFRVIRHVD